MRHQKITFISIRARPLTALFVTLTLSKSDTVSLSKGKIQSQECYSAKRPPNEREMATRLIYLIEQTIVEANYLKRLRSPVPHRVLHVRLVQDSIVQMVRHWSIVSSHLRSSHSRNKSAEVLLLKQPSLLVLVMMLSLA